MENLEMVNGDLEDRLEVFERRLARLRTVSALLFVLAGGAILLALRAPPAIPHAQAFVVRDSLGRVRGTLGMSGPGVALTFYDSAGRLRADLGIDQNGRPDLLLMTETGTPAAALNTRQDGSAVLRLMGSSGQRITFRPSASDGDLMRVEGDGGSITFRLDPVPAVTPRPRSATIPRSP